MTLEQMENERLAMVKRCMALEAEGKELGLLDWMQSGEGPQLGQAEMIELAQQTLAYTFAV